MQVALVGSQHDLPGEALSHKVLVGMVAVVVLVVTSLISAEDESWLILADLADLAFLADLGCAIVALWEESVGSVAELEGLVEFQYVRPKGEACRSLFCRRPVPPEKKLGSCKSTQ